MVISNRQNEKIHSFVICSRQFDKLGQLPAVGRLYRSLSSSNTIESGVQQTDRYMREDG
jgi:hypothetical protein